jgi:hypothetical protein
MGGFEYGGIGPLIGDDIKKGLLEVSFTYSQNAKINI